MAYKSKCYTVDVYDRIGGHLVRSFVCHSQITALMTRRKWQRLGYWTKVSETK